MKKIEMAIKCGEDGAIQFYTKPRINVEVNRFDIACLEYDTETGEWVKVKSVLSREEAAEWASETNILTDECECRMPRYMENDKIQYIAFPYARMFMSDPGGLEDAIRKSSGDLGDLKENIAFSAEVYRSIAMSMTVALDKCEQILADIDKGGDSDETP